MHSIIKSISFLSKWNSVECNNRKSRLTTLHLIKNEKQQPTNWKLDTIPRTKIVCIPIY